MSSPPVEALPLRADGETHVTRGLAKLLTVYEQALDDLERVRPEVALEARAVAQEMDLAYVR